MIQIFYKYTYNWNYHCHDEVFQLCHIKHNSVLQFQNQNQMIKSMTYFVDVFDIRKSYIFSNCLDSIGVLISSQYVWFL